jgi:hypothetical protein
MRLKMRLSLLVLLIAGVARAGDPPADWAFKPVSRPSIPAVQAGQLVRTPIDAFLLAELRTKQLSFSPEADRVTLIRRVTFDLIGLPPTPQEIDAFVSDKSKDAYEKLVDRLLHSPRYGERQATWWLDLVRYAESDGFKADDARPNAWRYRDYVIRSFNSDRRFDRFVREQLAGDEMFSGSDDALVATGFLRHFPDEYNAVNCEQRRQEILNDITDTTSAALLGITLGCARCHDHKFDPILQTDYYRIQAFFAAYKPFDVPVGDHAAIEHYRQEMKEWEAKTADLRHKIDDLEKPFREPEIKKQRQRFPEEYAHILDIPVEKRTPLQRQLAAMVEKQVYTRSANVSIKMKGSVKEQWDSMTKQMAELEKLKPPAPPTAMTMTDIGPEAPATRLLKRGDWRKPEDEVAPGFLSAFDDRDAELAKAYGATTGRRAALAQWITQRDNPLTTRVLVNRVWQTHFGKGIVGTPNDFGKQGDRPTHPELLDWLANEFVNAGWSFKQLHRLIVTSTAYRQSSQFNESAAKVDPENKLLWHMPRRRLDAEALRDGILAVSGRLSSKAGGPSAYPELPAELHKSAKNWKASPTTLDRNRRSVYVAVKRNLKYPLLAVFDAPDASEPCGRRFTTTTAPQALMLLNDQIVLEMAKQFASNVLSDGPKSPDAAIESAFRLALGRRPTTEERSAMRRFLDGHSDFNDGVTDVCHAILNLNEFLFVD